jgi:hypothetical protein
MDEMLVLLRDRNPEPHVMLAGLAAIFASYCRDAKKDPLAMFQQVTEGHVGRTLATIMDGGWRAAR